MIQDFFQEPFEKKYRVLLNTFVKKVYAQYPNGSFAGVPQPFLPAWGKNYDLALKRIAYVGIDTYGWHDSLQNFLKKYSQEEYDFSIDKKPFRDLKFLEWGNRVKSFWGLWFYILAGLYGVAPRHIKKGLRNSLVDDFVWGNCSALEIMHYKNVKDADYQFALAESQIFNSIEHLKNVFNMQVVVMVSSYCKQFLGAIKLEESTPNGVHVYRKDDLLIIQSCHPSAGRSWKAAYARARDIIVLLQKYGAFCKLSGHTEEGFPEEVKDFLAQECKRIGNKYNAIGMVALELCKQHACMSSRVIIDLLNRAGYTTDCGTQFTGNGSEPCQLVKSAYHRFEKSNRCDVSEAIAKAFTKDSGIYAYK